ncbi:MAG: hypothetical protein K9I29_04845 [Bacteroidales bacterium]|nr:hypothetical protein [Bacteroidales bacterium]MCF8327601.1 hypothetical protein [Bacteroidales bacterium]
MNDYKCPQCKAYLNVSNNVIFAAEKDDGTKGLILLHPEIGNFESDQHEKFVIGEGEKVEFKCPACNANLKAPKARNLAKIEAVSEDNKVFEVYFSRIKGEKSTYTLEGESVEIYGEHSENYKDYFELGNIGLMK